MTIRSYDTTAPEGATAEEIAARQTEARVHLAAAYRLVEANGWGESIFNHISMRVPGSPREFFIKRYDVAYAEVTASNLLRVSMDADLDERSAGVNRPGFVLHSSILRARPDVACGLHMHTTKIVAISALKRGLRMLSQYAVPFYGRIGYHDYEGLTDGVAEGPRIVTALGNGNALLLRNHGALTISASVGASFVAMSHLVEACSIQLMIESAGGEAIEIDRSVCERTVRQLAEHNQGRATAEWPAYLRMLDARDPSYRY